MEIVNYFEGLRYSSFDGMKGVYVFEQPENKNTFYYLASYETLEFYREKFYQLYAKFNHKVSFEFHHIVEKTGLEDFYSPVDIERLYNKIWPCVALDNYVHWSFNSVFRSKFSKDTVGKGIIKDPETRKKRINELQEFYGAAYSGKRIFQKIALNVINSLNDNG